MWYTPCVPSSTETSLSPKTVAPGASPRALEELLPRPGALTTVPSAPGPGGDLVVTPPATGSVPIVPRTGRTSAEPFLPDDRNDLDALRTACASCEGCPLHGPATQTVFGEGRPGSAVMLVGEEPGDHEDRDGVPFVGPAGRLLRAAMSEAGIAPESAYLTNAVKHFKFDRRGSVRLHKKPSAREVAACAPWLYAEIGAVHPRVVVALGATAGLALVGPELRVTRDRGIPVTGWNGITVVPTVHPASILRTTGHDARAEARRRFVADLESVRAMLSRPARRARAR
jgi:uracil-DNA glycosylase